MSLVGSATRVVIRLLKAVREAVQHVRRGPGASGGHEGLQFTGQPSRRAVGDDRERFPDQPPVLGWYLVRIGVR